MPVTAVVQSTTPLGGNIAFTSLAQFVNRGVTITGSVFADQNGTLKIQQGGDGINWDISQSFSVTAGNGIGFEVDLLDSYWRIVYQNGATPQAAFRLFANPRDPYGTFLQAQGSPSAGGAWAVLRGTDNNGGYVYVGRFDGNDGWDACSAAAVSTKLSAKYAAFLVDTATVADEVVVLTSQPTPDTF